jgi:hypothetical protein
LNQIELSRQETTKFGQIQALRRGLTRGES